MPLNKQKRKKLKKAEEYNHYQEDLAFAKELNILRNDFYYKIANSEKNELVDFLYKPLDVMSGDAYTAREIDTNRVFYLIVDGMGKGLSASLTAMIMTSFINHLIDKMKLHDSFSLDILIQESIEYMRPILLDEEAVAVDYILIDSFYCTMQYANFAMPTMLLQNKNKEIIRIKSNNPPISKYGFSYKISTYKTTPDLLKFLFYSDGVVENKVNGDMTYADFIEDDFASSYTREDLKNKLFERIETIEDDITLIFIHRLDLSRTEIQTESFGTSLDNIDIATGWYNDLLEHTTSNVKAIYNAGLVFTELYMNAYEHGNLEISSSEKNTLLHDDTYFDTLLEKEEGCSKKITVQVNKVEYGPDTYIITQITDEGNGFDTQLLSQIFRNSRTFNGRGVFISRKNSFGIYYNGKGNSVLYLNKV